MSERIDVTSRNFPGFFLLAAITRAKAVGDQIASNPVDVTLLVNGVELPVSATLEDLWCRAERELEARARKMAERMVTEAGLENVADALRDVEWRVKEALAQASATAAEVAASSEAAEAPAQAPTRRLARMHASATDYADWAHGECLRVERENGLLRGLLLKGVVELEKHNPACAQMLRELTPELRPGGA